MAGPGKEAIKPQQLCPKQRRTKKNEKDMRREKIFSEIGAGAEHQSF